MSRPRATLAAVALLVLAGCGGATTGGLGGPDGGDDATAGGTPTLTPVPVPTETTPIGTPTPQPTVEQSTPGGALVAPGLTAGGVADPFVLADAHRRSLTGEPYLLVRNTTVSLPDGRVLHATNRTLHVDAGGAPYRFTALSRSVRGYPVRPFGDRIDLWFTGARAYFRVVRNDSTDYQRDLDVSGTGPVGDLTLHDRIAGLVSAADLRLVAGPTPGENRVRVGTTRFATLSVLDVPPFLESPRNATLVMEVGPSGRIHGYRLAYDATIEGRSVHVVHTARFTTDVGPVERPAWVDVAVNATRTGNDPETDPT